MKQNSEVERERKKERHFDVESERKKARERDYPTGGNGRQKRKEVEWEDKRTGLIQSGSAA